MKFYTSLLRCDREFLGFLTCLHEQLSANKPLPIVVNGLTDGATLAALAETVRDVRREATAPLLLLVGSEDAAEKTAAALTALGLTARHFPMRDFTFRNMTASHDTERERLSVLSDIREGIPDVVVATAAAAASFTVPPDLLEKSDIRLSVGKTADMKKLASSLELLGYTRVDMVDGAGQFAVRGDILDIFVGGKEEPVRAEFFGDDIDRLSFFDPVTQRMTTPCPEVHILPAGEILPDGEARERVAAYIRKKRKTADAEEAAVLDGELSAIENCLSIRFGDKYLPLIYPSRDTLLSHIGRRGRAVVFFSGTAAVRENYKTAADRIENQAEECLFGAKDGACDCLAGEKEIKEWLTAQVPVHINPFAGGIAATRLGGLFGFRCRRTVSYGDNASLLYDDLMSFRKGGYRTLIICESEAGKKSLQSSLAEADIATAIIEKSDDFDYDSMQNGGIYLGCGYIEEGFELLSAKVAVLSMRRDSGRAIAAERRQRRILRRVGGAGERLMSYADLSVGDYVVHRNYGIGRFEGIRTVRVDGILRDYITLQYAGTDQLFVPCDRLEMIGKYIGQKEKDGSVRLSKMGSHEWGRTKARVKAAVENIAEDLIRLYAERTRTPGFAFPADGEEEREFADRFGFQETPSQLQAIEEVTADMMRPVPMNRLLCGDVGFGKTEVALRAAFKAILSGKQVAMLVPTTILAMQHYQTALSRMRGYAVNIEMLSRFCTPKEEATILRRVARGDVDLLIGTHKLLSGSLTFKNLGLLIVDEEQRFGVVQKEKLKTFASQVDVLTLTATPIPRTLNMAMNGISDMSVLEEAPADRRPVQTYVLEYDEGVIYDAIRRELGRHGQVLYLYNKTEDIDLVAGRLMKAFPDARVTYAHGRMEKDELEDIWQTLVRGETDILVCTTIIETGIDLPNANTLIMEGADRLGLSQMHQLRGRVGRSSRQAYAYFTYRKGKSLSEVATKRLAAIREFAEFGAGFKVALRDLEIRGAGNLLGAEQHGYMESVGYDLYVRLLSEAVLEKKGEKKAAPFEAVVDIKADANIPQSYIETSAGRMEMYKKISLIETAEDMQDVTDEFLDRYGEIPRATERLISVAFIRAAAAAARIRRVEAAEGYLRFLAEKPDLSVWSELFLRFPGLTFRTVGKTPAAVYCLRGGDDPTDTALKIMRAYSETARTAEGESTSAENEKEEGDKQR